MGKIETAFDAPDMQAQSPCFDDAAANSVKGQTAAVNGVGLRRVSHTALRRVRFVGRFIYWTFKHGSTTNAAWVCNYEGLYW